MAGADAAWVAVGRDPDALRLEVASGIDAGRGGLHAMDMSESLSARVVRSQTVLTVEDLGAEPGAVDLAAELGLPPLGPAIVVPLGSGRGVEGVEREGNTTALRRLVAVLDHPVPDFAVVTA